jgi:hypothetical protein
MYWQKFNNSIALAESGAMIEAMSFLKIFFL